MRAQSAAVMGLALVLLLAPAQAGIVWPSFIGGSDGNTQSTPRDIAVNNKGYSCITGQWNRSAASFSIGSYVFPKVTGGLFGSFVALKDPKGDLLWAQTFASASDASYAVDIDEMGNCYVAGTFKAANITIGDPTATKQKSFVLQNVAPWTDQISPFFTKLTKKDGSPAWATNLLVPGEGIPYSITKDKQSLYFAGYVKPAVLGVAYEISGFSMPACAGTRCMLVGKYSMAKGKWVWLKSFGGTSGSAELKWSGLSPKGDKLYVAGPSTAPGTQFGASVVENSAFQNAFFGVVNAKTGAAVDGIAYGGLAAGTGTAIANTLAVDQKTGAVYVAGQFSKTIEVGNNAEGTQVTLTTAATAPLTAAYIVKYSGCASKKESWNTVVWAQAFSTSAGSAAGIANLALGAPKQTVYVTAAYNGQGLDMGNGFAFVNNGYNSGFPAASYVSSIVARLDSSTGKVVAASDQVGGPLAAITYFVGGHDNKVDVDKRGNVYLFGNSAETYAGPTVVPYSTNAAYMATCGLPASALAPDSANLYWAKISTLDCNTEKVRCTSFKGCV